MTNLNPWKFGAVLSLTVSINYMLCAFFFITFPQPSIDFFNALFHGMDFHQIYVGMMFSPGSLAYALLVLAVWSYMLGVIYALVRNWLRPGATGAEASSK